MDQNIDSETVKSSETLFRIVESIREQGGATLTEVADDVEIAKSTAHRHLATLRKHEYVVCQNKKYQLGLKFLDLGGHVRTTNPVYQFIKPKVYEIAKEIGEINQFIVEENGKSVVIFREQGSQAVETESRVGERFLLHQTAGGKAILAHLRRERVEEIVDQYGLPAKTSNTITEKDALFDELETIKDQGVAFDREEHIPGLHAVGAPIKLPDGSICGSLGIGGPTKRMSGKRFKSEIPEVLLGVINALELNLKYSNVINE